LPRVADRGRVVAGVSTLTLVLTILMIQVTAAVPASAAVLVVEPSVGTGGVPATVTGSGFGDERVSLCWDKAGCSNLGQETPVLGAFTTAVTIPEDAVSGQHLIYACQSGDCSSAAIEVLGNDTTIPPETTTTTLEPTTSDPTTTSSTFQTTTTTPSSSTTTVFGSTTSQPSSSSSTTAGPGTTPVGTTPPPIFGPSPPPIFGPSPPPVFGTPTTSLPGITETTDPLAEDQDLNEDQDQEGQFGGADADPPAPSLDSVLSGVFMPVPEASSDSESVIGALDGGTPIPEASIGPDPQAQQSSGNRSVSDFPMPDLGVWALWLVVTVGVSAAALTFDALRQRRSR
jgi:hypothetical protein